MKTIVFVLCFLLCQISFSQTKNLKVILVNHEEIEENESLINAIKNLIIDIRQSTPNFNYSNINYQPIDFLKSPNLVEESTIGSMKAANFIFCNKNLTNQLIPIFIVKKRNQEMPYYCSYFIINKNSNIKSLNSVGIKKIVFVDKQSASGYIMPIHQLWESGVISKTSIKSVIEKFGQQNVVEAGGHKEVINMISKDDALNSLGLCGEIPDSNSNSTILLRYSYLPQDVIFVSQNLQQFIPEIKYWIRDNFNKGIFNNSSTQITGLEDFGLEYSAALNNLEKIIDRVEFCDLNPKTKKFKFSDLNSPGQLISFLCELTFKEIGLIIAFFLAVFSAGVTIAIKFPKVIEILKSK